MFTTLKIAGISALLSAGLVTAQGLPATEDAGPRSAKLYHQRIVQGPSGPASAEARVRFAEAASPGCAGQAWPYLAPECLTANDGTPRRKPVRTVTVETRDGPNTSVLVRLPAEAAAAR